MNNKKNSIIDDILKKFKTHQRLKYNEIYDKELCSSSHFDYYLKKIINEDLIEKKEDYYILTPKGIQYISGIERDISIKQKPLVCAFMLAINEENKFSGKTTIYGTL